MSSTSTSSTPTCSVCGKKHATKKLSLLVDDEHYSTGMTGMQDLLRRLREIYGQEEEEVPEEPEQPEEPEEPQEPEQPDTQGADKYGIRKLYPDAVGSTASTMWYFDMDNPTKDPRLGNEERAGLKKQPDGSWYLDGMGGTTKGQVRIEGRCESRNKKWLNGEVTVYAKYLNDLPNSATEPGAYAYQVYLRGANHSTSNPCIGSCYKIRIRKDKGVAIVKEIQHPQYSSNRLGTRKINQDIKGKWLGVKQVVYNFIQNNKTVVKIEIWVDENVTDSNGNLQIKNNWQKIAETVDSGNWKAMDSPSSCPAVDVDAVIKNRRQPDEIISMSGGTEDWNCAAYRTDGVSSTIKYFSVREIKPPIH